jgi:hypothetical protein
MMKPHGENVGNFGMRLVGAKIEISKALFIRFGKQSLLSKKNGQISRGSFVTASTLLKNGS